MRYINVSRQQSAPLVSPDIDAENDDLAMQESEIELPIDIARKGDFLIILAPMIGAKNEDINITVNNDILYIHKLARYPEEDVDNHYLKECHWDAIAREIQLPVSVDSVAARASLQDGVLKITLPIISNQKTRIIKIR